MRSRWMKVLSAALVALMLAACSGGAKNPTKEEPKPVEQQPAPAKPKVLTVAYHLEPETLSPYAATTLAAKELGVTEGFHVTDSDMNYKAMMVEQVPTLENGGVTINGNKMVVTWTLLKDLKWNDGKPVTTEDVLFTYNTVMNPGYKMDSRDGWDLIEQVEKVDERTVKVHFSKTYAAYRGLFRYLLPKHVFEGMDIDAIVKNEKYNRAPVSTAPFMVKEWKAGQYIHLVKNPYYRTPGLPKLDEIIFKFTPDANARINMLKTGDAQHMTSVDWARIDEIASISGLKINQTQANSWMHFDFNFKNPLFQDVRVREAIAHAIDKKSIVEKILGNRAKIANSPITPLSYAYRGDVWNHDFNVEKAKQLLEEAGWKVGSDGIREKGGQKLAFNNINAQGDATADRIQQVIQANLKAVGIDMEIKNVASTAFGGIRSRGEFDTKFHRWIVPSEPSITRFYHKDTVSPNGLNQGFYINEEVSKLMDEADVTVDQTKRKELLFKIQEELGKDLPTIQIYYNVLFTASSAKMKGYKGNPTNDSDGWNIEEWELEG